MIPISVRAADLTYYGFWVHFFTDRHMSIVSCSAELRFQVARSAEQFFEYECIKQLSTTPWFFGR